jgi:hypothetical protein
MRAEQYLRALAQLRARGMLSAGSPRQPTAIAHADPRLIDLIGWRVWRVVDGYLQSLTAGIIWLPGEVMAAIVHDHHNRGVHAFKSRADAVQIMVALRGTVLAYGSIRLWGDVVEHENGYRAERGRLLSIEDVAIGAPWSDERCMVLAFLRGRYCPPEQTLRQRRIFD